MSIFVESLGELNLSKGFFDFTWLDAPVLQSFPGAHDTPTWLDLEIFGDTGSWSTSAPSLVVGETSVGPSAPTGFDAPEGPLVQVDAAVLPDEPLKEVRWVDPFFDADLRPGAETRMEQVVLPVAQSGVWMTNPWGGVDYGFEMVYAIKNIDDY